MAGVSVNDIARFIGTWAVEPVEPMSGHTFTWELDGTRLRGRWIIEASEGPATQAARAKGLPTEFEIQVQEAHLEDGVLLFLVNGGPYPWEFRLAGDAHAVIGAAVGKLKSEFVAEHGRSIAGHQVRLTRRRPAAAVPEA